MGRSVEPVNRKEPDALEVPLLGGDLTEGLVRVGETVRRPRIAESDLIEALLLYLQRCRFDGAPRFLGIDDAGRQVLSFVHGEVAGRPWPDWVADDQRILSVARLVRRYDDAAQGFGLPPVPAAAVDPGPAGIPASTMGPATFVGHMDICPENVVFRDGQAWALIDFDLARPTNRLREVCSMLLWWAPLMPAQDREGSVRHLDVFARAALMVSAYGLAKADRALIAPAILNSTERTWHAMRHRAVQRGGPWQRLWDEGLGERLIRRRQWLEHHFTELHQAVTS